MARLYNRKILWLYISKKNVFLPPQNGEMAERSNAAVLKTVEGNTSGGSNPSLSARKPKVFENQYFGLVYEKSLRQVCANVKLSFRSEKK